MLFYSISQMAHDCLVVIILVVFRCGDGGRSLRCVWRLREFQISHCAKITFFFCHHHRLSVHSTASILPPFRQYCAIKVLIIYAHLNFPFALKFNLYVFCFVFFFLLVVGCLGSLFTLSLPLSLSHSLHLFESTSNSFQLSSLFFRI